MTVVEHVVRLFHNHGRRIVDIALDGAGRHEVLGATPGHPFYVEGHGWTDAGKLHAGDRVESGTGRTLRVRSVTARAGVSDTYNFEVERTHTYFVGKLRAWVHNACSEGGSATKGGLPSNGVDYDTISTAGPSQSAIPRDLNEQALFNGVRSSPSSGRPLPGLNNDPRFQASDGFQKMEMTHRLPDGKNVTVHYQYNLNTGLPYDIKVVTPQRVPSVLQPGPSITE